MLAKRIIPCLDVRDGKVVKGVNFEGIKEVGDPVECAYEYNLQGADEIVFYDITASHEGRGVMLDVVRETAKKVFVPLTVGGGIKTVDDIRETLRAGADKVSVNSQAVQNPQLIKEGADIFGSQCIKKFFPSDRFFIGWKLAPAACTVDWQSSRSVFLIFSSQLAAGGIDVSAQGAAHGGGDAPILQRFLESSHCGPGAGLQGALLHMVERDQIEMGGQALEPAQQLFGIRFRIVDPIDHGILEADAPGGLRVVPAAGVQKLLAGVSPVHRHDPVPGFIVGGVEGNGQG